MCATKANFLCQGSVSLWELLKLLPSLLLQIDRADQSKSDTNFTFTVREGRKYNVVRRTLYFQFGVRIQLLSANEKDRIFRCVQSLQIKPSGSGDENESKMTSSSHATMQPRLAVQKFRRYCVHPGPVKTRGSEMVFLTFSMRYFS